MAFWKREMLLGAGALLLVAIVAVSADSSEEGSKINLAVPYPQIRRDVYSAPSAKRRYDNSDSYEDARYQFDYKVRAGGKRSGYGSSENGASDSAEFGHSETRNGARTDGKYYVQLPDGRLQTVEYYVAGDSGFIAKVTYSGDARPVKAYATSGYKAQRVYVPRPVVQVADDSSSEEQARPAVRYVVERRTYEPAARKEERVQEVAEVAASENTDADNVAEPAVVVLGNEAEQAGPTNDADTGSTDGITDAANGATDGITDAASVVDAVVEAIRNVDPEAVDLRADSIPIETETSPVIEITGGAGDAANGAPEVAAV